MQSARVRIADLIGNPSANSAGQPARMAASYSKFFYQPRCFCYSDRTHVRRLGPNNLRNPCRLNFDMALFKHFAIKENMALEFRAEAFNVFNHPRVVIRTH